MPLFLELLWWNSVLGLNMVITFLGRAVWLPTGDLHKIGPVDGPSEREDAGAGAGMGIIWLSPEISASPSPLSLSLPPLCSSIPFALGDTRDYRKRNINFRGCSAYKAFGRPLPLAEVGCFHAAAVWAVTHVPVSKLSTLNWFTSDIWESFLESYLEWIGLC